MKRKVFKSVTVCSIVLSMLLSLAACGGTASKSDSNEGNSTSVTETTTTVEKKAPVEIVMLDGYDNTTENGKYMLSLYKRFQEKYADTIKLTIETTPNLDALIQKVKMMYASGDGPDIFNAAGYDITTIGATGDKIADMAPYLEADPELKSWVSQTNIDFNTRDGKLLSISSGSNVMAMWYNKEIFAEVGITPAKTWDEFWLNCEKLKKAGITPMSMDTRDTAWITNLLLGAIIGSSSDTGNQFMSQFHPKDFNNPDVINALKQVQKCFQEYAPENAAGANYDSAANSFLTGKTAMIFNGPWMIGDFSDKTKAPEGFSDKVATCLFPNDSVYVSGSTGLVVGNNGKDKVDAAMKFVKFFQDPEIQAELAVKLGIFPDAPVTFTDAQKAEAPLLIDAINVTSSAKLKILQSYQSAWYTNVCDTFTTLYPQLIYNKITAEDFAKQLTEIAQKNQ